MNNTPLIVAALAFVGVFYWWRNQQGLEPNENSDTQNSIGDTLTTIKNSLWVAPAGAKPYLAAIAAAEAKYGLPKNILARLLHQESRFRQDIITGKVKSPVGAVGIAQFMPATAKQFGVNPLDPFQSIDGAGRYLKQLYSRFGSWDKALASYNWGQGNVARKGLDKAPLETRNYISQIMQDIGLT